MASCPARLLWVETWSTAECHEGEGGEIRRIAPGFQRARANGGHSYTQTTRYNCLQPLACLRKLLVNAKTQGTGFLVDQRNTRAGIFRQAGILVLI